MSTFPGFILFEFEPSKVHKILEQTYFTPDFSTYHEYIWNPNISVQMGYVAQKGESEMTLKKLVEKTKRNNLHMFGFNSCFLDMPYCSFSVLNDGPLKHLQLEWEDSQERDSRFDRDKINTYIRDLGRLVSSKYIVRLVDRVDIERFQIDDGKLRISLEFLYGHDCLDAILIDRKISAQLPTGVPLEVRRLHADGYTEYFMPKFHRSDFESELVKGYSTIPYINSFGIPIDIPKNNPQKNELIRLIRLYYKNEINFDQFIDEFTSEFYDIKDYTMFRSDLSLFCGIVDVILKNNLTPTEKEKRVSEIVTEFITRLL